MAGPFTTNKKHTCNFIKLSLETLVYLDILAVPICSEVSNAHVQFVALIVVGTHVCDVFHKGSCEVDGIRCS